jgi:hypothetical protein
MRPEEHPDQPSTNHGGNYPRLDIQQFRGNATFPHVKMDLSLLLMTASISAGVNMILFFLASAVALLYYKRFKKLQQQIAQDAEALREGADPSEASAQPRGNVIANRAREERRQRRRREEFRPQAQEDVPYLNNTPPKVEERDMMELRPASLKDGQDVKKDTRGDAVTV